MGGVLGLSTGFSLITVIELIYWFTVRILHDHCRKNKVNPESSNNEESPQTSDKTESSNQKTDYEKLKSRMDKFEESIAEIKASNAEIKVLLQDILRGRSSRSRQNDICDIENGN